MARDYNLAAGYLQTIPFHDVEYLPVTCSHTFAALNIIEAGSACLGLHEKLATDGKIDQAKALQLCPSWKKPMTEGIPCIVFRRELEELCPELPEFLSKAGNQSHDVHSKETKVQLMLNMNRLFVGKKRMAASTLPAGSAPATSAGSATAAPATWAAVVKEISNMKPHFADVAAEAADFASAWSGGDDSQYLKEVEEYAKSLKVRREPEAGQLSILAKAQLRRAPKWAIACLKTLLQAPDVFCRRNGEAYMFSSTDVKAMETKMSEILKATALMEKAREWLGPAMHCLLYTSPSPRDRG